MASTQTTSTSSSSIENIQRTNGGIGTVNTSTWERWGAVIGGSGLTIGGAVLSLTQKKWSIGGIALMLGGGALIYRGASGHSFIYQGLGISTAENATDATGTQPANKESTRVEIAMTINRSPDDMYHFWEGLGSASALTSANTTPTREQGQRIIEEKEYEQTAWNELKEAVAAQGGYVHFAHAPNGRGTEVRVTFEYNGPGSNLGSRAAKLMSKPTKLQITEKLRHFKEVMEAGEIPTTEGQPIGNR
jgi:uncharacterized membrane protein